MTNTQKREALEAALNLTNDVLALPDISENTEPGQSLITAQRALHAALDRIPRRNAPDYSAAATRSRMPDGSISASRFLAECDRINGDHRKDGIK